MAAPVIRDATSADLPRLVELLAQLSLDEQREAPGPTLAGGYVRAFEAIEADPRQRVLVVEEDGRVEASLVLIIVPNLSHRGSPWAAVENVVVDATKRRSGYGRLLMQAAIGAARAAGCYKLALTSNKRRPDAHRFYEGLGFRATHEGFRIEF